ncbi:MAG: TonB-dependent receptor, partial [Lentisphaeraceae bacterium]|nr:TonB-dependent receptor [Lentisphaeraceae bacterium]
MFKVILISIFLSFSLAATEKQLPSINEPAKATDVFIISATNRLESLFDTSLSIGRVEGEDIDKIRPAHPSEVVNRIPGVFVNNLGGESHFTAIRNNLSTGANYLFLENGVPTRSTGFFNHNALYEINVPQSSGVEVIKGPGSALYGSDAMHGVINVQSGKIPDDRLIKLGLEYGTNNWYRQLFTYGDRINDEHAFRVDVNNTLSKGWRINSEYSRQSVTAQWLWTPSDDFTMKSVFSYTFVDQSLQSGLTKEDWKDNPEDNYYRLPGRDVESFRFSTKMTKKLDETSEINFTPYYRNSFTYGLIPSWKLSTFSNNSEIYDSGFYSFGTLISYVKDFETMDSTLILGFDYDYSPGKYSKEKIEFTSANSNGNKYFLDYSKTGEMINDFDATYSSYSPYIHYEFSPLENLRIDTGLRYDYASFDLDQHLSGATAIENTKVNFDQFSPKFGFNWDFSEDHQLYGSYRRGFRAPSASALFVADASEGSTDLEATIVDSFELGLRGFITEDISYDLTAYTMFKKDDIVTYRDPNTKEETATNNGETEHRGVELGINWRATDEWTLAV